MTCTHTASTKGDYEDPYKPAARSSLELTIMPAVGASSAFSIVVVPLSERNVSALAGAFSRPQLAAHHGTLTRDLDSLLAEAQILLYLLLALQCIQELVLGLGNIHARSGMRNGWLPRRTRTAALTCVLTPCVTA
jgi:hypothetical protein